MLALQFLSSLLLVGSSASAAVVALPRAILPRAAPTVPIIEMHYPTARGTPTVNTTSIGPCQGFPVGARSQYPISQGANIALNMSRDGNDVIMRYSTLANPTSNDDFISLPGNLSQVYKGSRCINQPDFAAAGLSVGDELTLQLTYYSGPTSKEFFECADIVLVENSAFVATEHYCLNVTESTQTRGGANEIVANASTSSSSAAVAGASSTAATGAAGRTVAVGGLSAFALGAVALLL